MKMATINFSKIYLINNLKVNTSSKVSFRCAFQGIRGLRSSHRFVVHYRIRRFSAALMESFGINAPMGNALMGRKESTNKAKAAFITKH